MRLRPNCCISSCASAAAEWKMPPREWSEAKTQFAIMFDERFVQSVMAQPASHTEFLTVPIQGHLLELYGMDVSPDLISAVTDAVLEEVAEWQNRPLEAMLSAGFLRRAAGQDPRRGPGSQQGHLHRARRARRRHQGDPGPLDRDRPRAPNSGCAS